MRPKRLSVASVIAAVMLAGCFGPSAYPGPGPDVDCAGGSGDGPRYVDGPVTVDDSDPFDLDRDGDGVGCE